MRRWFECATRRDAITVKMTWVKDHMDSGSREEGHTIATVDFLISEVVGSWVVGNINNLKSRQDSQMNSFRCYDIELEVVAVGSQNSPSPSNNDNALDSIEDTKEEQEDSKEQDNDTEDDLGDPESEMVCRRRGSGVGVFIRRGLEEEALNEEDEAHVVADEDI
eukprot:Gb_34948 [translate_table: standard]